MGLNFHKWVNQMKRNWWYRLRNNIKDRTFKELVKLTEKVREKTQRIEIPIP